MLAKLSISRNLSDRDKHEMSCSDMLSDKFGNAEKYRASKRFRVKISSAEPIVRNSSLTADAASCLTETAGNSGGP